MVKLTAVVLIFCTAACVLGQKLQFPKIPKIPGIPKLPTPIKFLEELLNATAQEVITIAERFTFVDVFHDEVDFLMYKKDGSAEKFDVTSDQQVIIEDPGKPIKFIIHGWQSGGEADFVKAMARAYHETGLFNVFGVDWSLHSKKVYLFSAKNTKKVGEIVGKFILKVLNYDKNLLKNVHIIGHSLGAQVAGFAGKYIHNATETHKIDRITGLDVAAPLFEYPLRRPKHHRLHQDDAEFVDAIHTNAGFLGWLARFGNADYYIDYGGPIQPGCLNINIFESFVCSHAKSHTIYTKTITSKDYLALTCSNPVLALASLCDKNEKVIMGEHTMTKADGEYYINIDKNLKPQKRLSIVPLE